MKLKVWTRAYRPFIMGGDINAPIATKVKVGDPVCLGHNIKIYVVTSPTGHIHIAESTTGGFVGIDLEQVKSDIAAADPEVIKSQLVEAAQEVKKAQMMEPKKFWALFQPRI